MDEPTIDQLINDVLLAATRPNGGFIAALDECVPFDRRAGVEVAMKRRKLARGLSLTQLGVLEAERLRALEHKGRLG